MILVYVLSRYLGWCPHWQTQAVGLPGWLAGCASVVWVLAPRWYRLECASLRFRVRTHFECVHMEAYIEYDLDPLILRLSVVLKRVPRFMEASMTRGALLGVEAKHDILHLPKPIFCSVGFSGLVRV